MGKDAHKTIQCDDRNRLIQTHATAVRFRSAPAPDGQPPKPPTFEIQAYNGGPMVPDYYYAPVPVVIDLSKLRASEPVSILLDHRSSAIIGQSISVQIGAAGVVVQGKITGDVNAEDDPAYKVMLHSRNGFVWKASMGIHADAYEHIAEGDFATINGQPVEGPCYVMRGGNLLETSFLSVGADSSTSVRIAAKPAKGNRTMEFNSYIKGLGLDPTDLEDEVRSELLEHFQHKTGSLTAAPATGKEPTDPMERLRAKHAAIRQHAADFAEKHPDEIEWAADMADEAIRCGINPAMFPLHLLRSRGSQELASNRFPGNSPDSADVFAARLLCGNGLSNKAEKWFGPKVAELASRRPFKSFQAAVDESCQMNGLDTNSSVQNRIHAAMNFRASGSSTYDLANGVLANITNKSIVEAVESLERTSNVIADVRSTGDFRPNTLIKLQPDFALRQLPPGGTVQHGTMSEVTTSEAAGTFARNFSVSRTDFQNDDP